MLLERYMDAAGKVSALAIGDPDIGPASETFRIRQDASQDIHLEGMPIGTVGGILAKVTLPLDGDYVLSVRMFRNGISASRADWSTSIKSNMRSTDSVSTPSTWAARRTSRRTSST